MLTNSESGLSSRFHNPGGLRRHGLLCLCVVLSSAAASLPAYAAFTTFDPLGSVRTQAGNINQHGNISGTYWDAGGNTHGFFRKFLGGTITNIDYPDALETVANQINVSDSIVGYYEDSALQYHGFLWTAGGATTTVDYPGSTLTSAELINDQGAITGFYEMASTGGHYHGFVRHADETFETYDVPGASDTLPECISNRGSIAGYYRDIVGDRYVVRGFLRDPYGTITLIDVHGALATVAVYVDDATNKVMGYYVGADNFLHGFLRTPSGTILTSPYDVPGATQTRPSWEARTLTGGLKIDGYALDATSHATGYLRHPGGGFVTFEVPGAGIGSTQGTYPAGMTANKITGYYIDSSNVEHGFVGYP